MTNQLQNMACVADGTSSLKKQSILAMNTAMSNAIAKFEQQGKPAEAIAKLRADCVALSAKASGLSDEFFAGIDCGYNFDGLSIARAVSAA